MFFHSYQVAIVAASLLTILLSSTVVTAFDVDCGEGYTGYSLKLGSQCRSYVYCNSGTVSSTTLCPGSLIYDGNVGVGGVCGWPNTVTCADVAAAAAPTTTTGAASSGESAGSNNPISIVNVDTDEANSLAQLLNNNPSAGAAVPTTTTGAASTGESPGSNNPISIINVDTDEANSLAQLLNNNLSPSPPSANSVGIVPSPTPPTQPIINAPATSTVSIGLTSVDTGFCGGSKIDAEAKCVPCVERMCNDFTEACWMETSCSSSGNINQPSPPSPATDTALPPPTTTETVVAGTSTTETVVAETSTPETVVVETPTAETVVAETVSVPTMSPTLPPWTNAPFVPYKGPHRDKTVIGYYASWQWYDRVKFADPQNIDWSKYDRINYAFFQIDKEGEIYGTDEWADPQLLFGPYVYDVANQIQTGPGANSLCSWDGPGVRNCNYHDTSKGIIELAHKVQVEVYPSIGGWTLSDNFPTVAASERTRKNFAKNCVKLLLEYNFDGLDIDWEYPGYEPHKGTKDDKYTYTLFLAEIRKELDELGRTNNKHYKLTAALPCGPDKITNIQVDQIKDILDEFNLMTYDLHGAWDMLTGTNAPLTDQGWTDKTQRWSVHGCTDTYAEYGVPFSKINLGLPFYGRSFRRATGMKQFHEGTDDVNFHLDEGSPQYFNIVNELKRMTTYRHEKTKTQYAVFNNPDGGLVSYDDPRAICDKVHYANQRGMNGFLVWEISGDMLDNGETPLIDAANDKINDPSLDCSKLRDPLWSLSSSTYLYAPDEPDEIDMSKASSFVVQSAGSTNDFNGAQDAVLSRPASTSTSDSDASSQNQVYTPSYTVDTGSSSSGSSSSSSVELAPPITEGPSDCPVGYTGYWTSAGCTTYFQCQDGNILGAPQPCVPGTLFDVNINTCAFAANVRC